jgi:hypothetical protein
VARVVARSADGVSAIGPFDAPAVWLTETPVDLIVTPTAAPSVDATAAVVATPATGPIETVQRLSVALVLGGSWGLDPWCRAAVIHDAAATGEWLDAGGAVIASFPGGPSTVARPSTAVALRSSVAASLATLLW